MPKVGTEFGPVGQNVTLRRGLRKAKLEPKPVYARQKDA